MKISVKKSSLAPCPLADVNPGEIFWCDHIIDINNNPVLFMRIDPNYDDDKRFCAIDLDTFMINKLDVHNMLVYTAKSDLLIDMSQNA